MLFKTCHFELYWINGYYIVKRGFHPNIGFVCRSENIILGLTNG